MSVNTIGERLKRLRNERGLTQGYVATALGVKRQTVNQWERELRDFKTATIIDLANFYGVSCDYILRGIDAKSTDVYRKLGISDKVIDEIIKLRRNPLNFQENYLLNKLFDVENNQQSYFGSILMKYQELFYFYINAICDEKDNRNIEYRKRVNTISKAKDESGNEIDGLYCEYLTEDDYVDKKLQELARELKSLMVMALDDVDFCHSVVNNIEVRTIKDKFWL